MAANPERLGGRGPVVRDFTFANNLIKVLLESNKLCLNLIKREHIVTLGCT